MVSPVERRHSESREPLTPEPQDAPQHRRRKKKKAQQTPDSETSFMQTSAADVPLQEDLQNGTSDKLPSEDDVPRKPKKKGKKTRPADLQYANELGVEEDDIVTDVQQPNPPLALFAAPLGSSQPVGKVFVERNREYAT
ncbi:TM237 protein, partial [Polypterus senegalus]